MEGPTMEPGDGAQENRALLAARLQAEEHPLTVAILAAFRQTDWDELTALTGDLPTGLARLAAAAAWMEGKREDQPTEDTRRHREAQHRSSLSLVANHRDEWNQLMRGHRLEIDRERGHSISPPTPTLAEYLATDTNPPPKGLRGAVGRLRQRWRKSA
jgi:hypothetical protein